VAGVLEGKRLTAPAATSNKLASGTCSAGSMISWVFTMEKISREVLQKADASGESARRSR